METAGSWIFNKLAIFNKSHFQNQKPYLFVQDASAFSQCTSWHSKVRIVTNLASDQTLSFNVQTIKKQQSSETQNNKNYGKHWMRTLPIQCIWNCKGCTDGFRYITSLFVYPKNIARFMCFVVPIRTKMHELLNKTFVKILIHTHYNTLLTRNNSKHATSGRNQHAKIKLFVATREKLDPIHLT